MTFAALRRRTSSLASAAGPTQLDLLDWPTTPPCGPAPAPANPSALPESSAGLPTNGTCGPSGSGSSAPCDLSASLANRLKQRLGSAGSTLFNQTWKPKATPLGRSYWAHTASGHRTSDSGCGSWPTPMAGTPAQNGYNAAGNTDSSRKTVALLASWPTPTTRDHKDGSSNGTVPINGLLGRAVWLAGWPTPTTQDDNCSRIADPQEYAERRLARANKCSNLAQTAQAFAWAGATDQPARLTASGKMLIGSSAATANGGQLNPAFSLWLMGYLPEWESCAPLATRSSRRLPPRS